MSSLKDSDLFNWVRDNQSNKRLSQSQVDAVNTMLVTMSADVVQDTLSNLMGWSVSSDSGLKLSKRGIELMKRYEGFRSAPYRDMVGVNTIGYGNTYYPDRRKVQLSDAHLTEPQAEQLAMDIVNLDFAPAVNNIFKDEIASGKLNQNMFDALVSLAYNIGVSALANSNSVTGNIKKGRYNAAANGFLLWNKGRVNGRLQPIRGLTRRRTEERELFLS